MSACSLDLIARPMRLGRMAGCAGEGDVIDPYYWSTPNGHKTTMLLEQAGRPYEIRPVDINAGDQRRYRRAIAYLPEWVLIQWGAVSPSRYSNQAAGGAPTDKLDLAPLNQCRARLQDRPERGWAAAA
jgi:hypothetical protein